MPDDHPPSLHIVSAANDGFIAPYAAMLHSAHLFHPDAAFWLLAHEVSAKNIRKVQDFALDQGISLQIVDTSALLANLPVHRHAHTVSYARVLIPDLLPASVARALWLDADITVTQTLKPLFEIDLDGKPAAAVADPFAAVLERITLKLSAAAIYCNAGVLLMDLQRWRAEEITSSILEFARAHPHSLHFLDQSALNAVLAERIFLLPRRWNLFDWDQWEEANPPAVLHYTAGSKPWKNFRSPFSELFALHQNATPFPFVPPPKRRLQHYTRVAAAALGLRRYRLYRRSIGRDAMIQEAIVLPALQNARRLMAQRPREPLVS